MAHGVVGATEPPAVAQLGQDRWCQQGADAVQLVDQCLAARLTLSERPQPPVARAELTVEQVDHPQRQLDQVTAGRRQAHVCQRRPAADGARLDPRCHALVEQLCVHPLLPADALVQ